MATNMLMPRIPLKSQEEELAAREQEQDEEINIGPLSMLTSSMRNKTEVLISCRNNKKLLGKIKAFDCHCNLIMEDVREMWTKTPKLEKGKAGASNSKKKAKPIAHDRFIPKLFVRGDSVVMVLKNPFGTQPEAAQSLKQKSK